MYDVLPYIDETPAENFNYQYDGKLGGMAITDYTGKSPKVRVPDTLDGELVVKIELDKSIELTHLYAPTTIVQLSVNTEYLKYMNLPMNLQERYQNVIIGCKNLEAVYIPYGMETLPPKIFSGCKNLTHIDIPDTVTRIDSEAFRGCIALESIDIPESVTVIGEDAFAYCNLLKSVKVPDSLTTNLPGVFAHCAALETAELPDSITTLSSTFNECKSLKTLDIPDSVKTFGKNIFSEGTEIEYKGKTYSAVEFQDYIDSL